MEIKKSDINFFSNVAGCIAAATVAIPVIAIAPFLMIPLGMACGKGPNATLEINGVDIHCATPFKVFAIGSITLPFIIGYTAKKITELSLNYYFKTKEPLQQFPLRKESL